MKGSFRQPESYIAALWIGLILLTGCGRGVDQDAPSGSPNPFTENEIRFTDNEIPQPVPPPVIESARINPFNPDAVCVTWLSGLAGDVDGDGEVAGTDVFPLAIHYLENSNHGGHVADRPGADCADANRDGLVDGADLFVIAAEFGVTVEDYRAWKCDRQVGAYEPLNMPVSKLELEDELKPCMRRWEIVDESDAAKERWYAVTSISSSGEESILSNRGQAVEEEGDWVIEEFASGGRFGYYFMDCAQNGQTWQVWKSNREWVVSRECDTGWEQSTRNERDMGSQNNLMTAGQNGHLGFAGAISGSAISWFDGQKWEDYFISDNGIASTMAFDSRDAPVYASVRHVGTYAIGLSRFDGLIWNSQVIEDDIKLTWPGIEMDHQDRAWIAYAPNSGGLWLAREQETGWQKELVDDILIGHGGTLVLRLDQFDNPWIAYATVEDGFLDTIGLRVAHRGASGGWVQATVAEGKYSHLISMRLDENGLPILSYMRFESGAWIMCVTWLSADGWQTREIAACGTIGMLPGLGFDKHGYPRIGWLDTSKDVIYHANYR